MNDIMLGGLLDEFEKIGARKGLKIIRQLAEKGDPASLEKARRIASASKQVAPNAARQQLVEKLKAMGTPKAMARARELEAAGGGAAHALKPTPMGHQVKRLGRGSEGQADLVAGASMDPNRGLAVRKLYDPNSPIASPELIRRKLDLAEKVKHPALADVYGVAKGPHGQYGSLHEFVPGRSPNKLQMQAMGHRLEGLKDEARRHGYELADVRAANIVGDKVVDPLPFINRPGRVEYQGKVVPGAENQLVLERPGREVIGMGHRGGALSPREQYRILDPLDRQAMGATPEKMEKLKSQARKKIDAAYAQKIYKGHFPQGATPNLELKQKSLGQKARGVEEKARKAKADPRRRAEPRRRMEDLTEGNLPPLPKLPSLPKLAPAQRTANLPGGPAPRPGTAPASHTPDWVPPTLGAGLLGLGGLGGYGLYRSLKDKKQDPQEQEAA